MSEILKQGVTLSAITKGRTQGAVLITKKKRRSADTDNKVKLYTDNYDKLKGADTFMIIPVASF